VDVSICWKPSASAGLPGRRVKFRAATFVKRGSDTTLIASLPSACQPVKSFAACGGKASVASGSNVAVFFAFEDPPPLPLLLLLLLLSLSLSRLQYTLLARVMLASVPL
jgi:hypothetical protein